jgi:hypothetical protein
LELLEADCRCRDKEQKLLFETQHRTALCEQEQAIDA